MVSGPELSDARPIWIQLAGEYRRRIAAGEWAAGARIPSVRELALESQVNPNTVQRALGDLDRAGLTVTERTAGRFVAEDRGAIDDARSELAASAADQYIHTVAGLGIGRADARALLDERWPLMKEE